MTKYVICYVSNYWTFVLFYCLGVSMTDCTETGYVNEWDQYHKYFVPTGKVITGITSYHNGHHE